jgi:Meiotically up-regulated gene 113
MKKEQILQEIKRTAEANGGTPLGWRKFAQETGIRERDWSGKHWARWGEAVREAGYAPNRMTEAYEEAELLERFVLLARELKRLPTDKDLRLKAHQNTKFPDSSTFGKLGRKTELVKRVMEYCRTREGHEDIIVMCEAHSPSRNDSADQSEPVKDEVGYVYLMKSGSFYKLGRSNAAGRREYELAIQLPEKLRTVHVIRTDDPPGIEIYWHNRFAVKRKNGEWFDLDAADVAAFKRRKFM